MARIHSKRSHISAKLLTIHDCHVFARIYTKPRGLRSLVIETFRRVNDSRGSILSMLTTLDNNTILIYKDQFNWYSVVDVNIFKDTIYERSLVEGNEGERTG